MIYKILNVAGRNYNDSLKKKNMTVKIDNDGKSIIMTIYDEELDDKMSILVDHRMKKLFKEILNGE